MSSSPGVDRAAPSADAPSDFLIAGLRVRLGDVDAATREDFEARLPEFRVERDGEAEITLAAERVRDSPNPDLYGADTQTVREPAGGRVAIRRCDFDGSWDPSQRVAECRYSESLASFNCFLRVVCSFALLEKGGVLLHASSVVSRDRAFAFVGPSGAGKTTVARLGAPRPVLSDEVTALRPARAPGPPASFTCFPTPFWGEMVRVRAGPSAPLAALGFPARSDVGPPRLRPARGADAFSRLLECVIAFDLSGIEKASVLDVAAAIVRAVPCVHVEYPLNQPPWDLLDALPSPP